MSGMEVFVSISAVINIIDTSIEIYNSTRKDLKLSETFQTVGERLSVILDALQTCKNHLEPIKGSTPKDVFETVEKILDACDEKARKLREIFEKVLPGEVDAWEKRYLKVIKTFGKGNQVEELMLSMTEDVHLIINHHAVKSAKPEQNVELDNVIKEMKSIKPSVPTTYDSNNNNDLWLGHPITCPTCFEQTPVEAISDGFYVSFPPRCGTCSPADDHYNRPSRPTPLRQKEVKEHLSRERLSRRWVRLDAGYLRPKISFTIKTLGMMSQIVSGACAAFVVSKYRPRGQYNLEEGSTTSTDLESHPLNGSFAFALWQDASMNSTSVGNTTVALVQSICMDPSTTSFLVACSIYGVVLIRLANHSQSHPDHHDWLISAGVVAGLALGILNLKVDEAPEVALLKYVPWTIMIAAVLGLVLVVIQGHGKDLTDRNLFHTETIVGEKELLDNKRDFPAPH